MHKAIWVLNLNIFTHYTKKLKVFIISHNHQEYDFDGLNQKTNKQPNFSSNKKMDNKKSNVFIPCHQMNFFF